MKSFSENLSSYLKAQSGGTPNSLNGGSEGEKDKKDLLQNSIQELTLTKDRAFKMLLDKMDEDETKIKAGEVLVRQLRERVIPEIEKYKFEIILKTCDTKSQTVTGLAANAYNKFLEAQEKLNDADVHQNRIVYVIPEFLFNRNILL